MSLSRPNAWNTLKNHWPEYLMEAAGLGLFMVSACGFATLLEHPESPARQALESPLLRRLLMGAAMGLTAAGIIYSPWGQRSGAHLNPAVTLTFFRLGKVEPADAFFYVVFQFLGGAAGVVLMALLLPPVSHPAVNYVVTVPGRWGAAAAFGAELAISAILMLVILVATNHEKLFRYTGWLAGLLLMLYITFEAPLSGMSINPARTVASAVPAGVWRAVWVYFAAPAGGMLLAGWLYVWWKGPHAVLCAKLNHWGVARCIFHCRIEELGVDAPLKASHLKKAEETPG